MRSTITLLGLGTLLAGSAVQAIYMCPVMPSSSDAAAVEYGLGIQSFLSDYYTSVPVNATFFSTLPNNTVSPTDFLGNLKGLDKQAMLGVEALQQLSASIPSFMKPTCKFKYPPVTDAKSHLMNAYVIEATLCGAFIGLADYVESPQAAFLMARMAAEHGIHASYIGSHMQAQVFKANSTSLTPAFTPEEVLKSGTGVGMLGQYLSGCVSAPTAPCGGTVNIGMLNANLSSQRTTTAATTTTGMSKPLTMSGMSKPSGMSGSSQPTATTTGAPTFTGAAESNKIGIGRAMSGAAMVALFLM